MLVEMFGGGLCALSWCGKEVVRGRAFVAHLHFGLLASALYIHFL